MAITLQKLVTMFNITPDENGSSRAKTPEFRASYANVFEPRETPSGDMKYSISMIFQKSDKDALKDVAQAILNAAAKKFGNNPDKWPKNMKCPIRDGDEDRDGNEYEGSVFMNAGNKNQPGIIDKHGKALTETDEFYSGCYARASISFYPYDTAGNKGVGAGLNNLLFVRDGERLDNAVAAETDFADEIEEPTVADENAALDNADNAADKGEDDDSF